MNKITLSIIDTQTDKLESLRGKWSAGDASIIGGDLVNTGYLALLITRVALPAIANSPSVHLAIQGFGILTGIINIGIAIESLRQAIESSKNPENKTQTIRLYSDAITLLLLGLVMIGSETISPVPEAALATLFFISAIPVIYEIGEKLAKRADGQDLGSKLQLDKVRCYINQGQRLDIKDHLWGKIGLLQQNDIDFQELYNYLQAEIGIEAAIPTFQLISTILTAPVPLEKEPLLQLVDQAEKKIDAFYLLLKFRMGQQLLFFLGFIACIQTIPGLSEATQELFQYSILTAANGLALYPDIFKRFQRTTPIIPSPVGNFILNRESTDLIEAPQQ